MKLTSFLRMSFAGKLKSLLSLTFGFAFFLLCVGVFSTASSQTRQTITNLQGGEKILWIGNSYSGFYGPTYEALNALLNASTPAIQNVTFADKGKGMGIVLEYATWNSLGVIEEIRKGGWAYVVIQSWEDAFYTWDSGTLEDGSTNPKVVGGRDEAARIKARDVLLANIKILDAEIKKVGAKTIMFEPHPSTWDYLYVYEASQKTYSEILPSLNCIYAPVLWAWNKVKADYPTSRYECAGTNSDGFIKMLYSDCGHQNWDGTALDAYTFYTMFTGKSAVGLNPTHQVFSTMKQDKNYLAGVGNTVGLQIRALNNGEDAEAPTAPTNLQTSELTTTSVKLTWTASTDNKGVSSYEIFAGSVSKGTTNSTTFTITGLSAATIYSLTVKAKDAAGNVSPASSAKSITTLVSTDTQKPTKPTALISSAITPTSFTLSWTASTDNEGVVGYEIFKNGVSVGTSATISYNVTGLSASNTYAMTVKAKDAAGNISDASVTKNITTTAPDTQSPSIPTGLNATGISSTTFTLNWSASTDNVAVARYEVYMNGAIYGTTTSTETNMPIPFLDPATQYTMTVKAKDEANNISAASENLVVTTKSLPMSTELLWSESFDTYTEGQLIDGLNGWDYQGDPATASYSATTAGLVYPGLLTTGGALKGGGSYDNCGVKLPMNVFTPFISSFTGQYGETIIGYNAANARNELWASCLVKIVNASSDNAIGFQVDGAGWAQYKSDLNITDGTGGKWGLAVDSHTTPEKTSTSLVASEAGKTYLLVVKFTFGAASTTMDLYVNPTIGVMPSIPDATVSTTSHQGFSNFSCYLAGDNKSVLDEMRLGGSYGAVTPAGIISTITESTNMVVNIYPNPAQDQLNIGLVDELHGAQLSVIDVQGRVIIKKSIQNTTVENLDISTLSRGVYMLKVTNAKHTSNFKFVKQ